MSMWGCCVSTPGYFAAIALKRSSQKGIVVADRGKAVRGHHLAMLGVVVAAPGLLVPVDREAVLAARGLEHALALGHDLLADAVAGDHSDAVIGDGPRSAPLLGLGSVPGFLHRPCLVWGLSPVFFIASNPRKISRALPRARRELPREGSGRRAAPGRAHHRPRGAIRRGA